jgi:hypothetical protein
MNDQSVLANHHLSNSTYNQAESHSGYLYPSRKLTLIEFSGAEGEDFRNFEEALESYFAMHNILADSRKLLILRAQLRRTAKNFFERRLAREPVLEPGLTYQEAIDMLKVEYVTPELITRYTIGFNLLAQGKEEHPKTFLGRLQEAAQLAELEDAERQIKIRFQVGLLPEIRKFCVLNSAVSFNDYLTKAEGWWNAEKPRSISMKNSPFAPRDIDNYFVTEPATKPNLSFGDLSSSSDFSVMDVSGKLNTALANLGTDRNALKQVIASLQSIELNHMENQNTASGFPLNLKPQTENLDIKEMIREVMQEEFKKQDNNNNNNSSYRRNNNYENRRYNNDRNYERRNDYSRGNDGRNYNNNSNQRNNNYDNNNNGNYGNHNQRNDNQIHSDNNNNQSKN